MVQAWQAVHPPLRGRYWTGQRPRVHAGFLKSWLAGNLKAKVINTVLKSLQDQNKAHSIQRVLVTGASSMSYIILLLLLWQKTGKIGTVKNVLAS